MSDNRGSRFPQRDFGLYPQPSAEKKDDAAYVVVGTCGDNERFWLDAGAAMMQLMLNAQLAGLCTSPVTQPVDNPAFRTRLGLFLGGVDTPQFLLRIGAPVDSVEEIHHVARRPVSEVID